MGKKIKPVMVALGSEIRKAREKLGLTQKECSRRIGCVESSVSYWEKGCSIPDSKYWKGIKEVLGVDLCSHQKELRMCANEEGPSAFGEKLCKIRTDLGLSVGAFTKLIFGHNGDSVRKWECGYSVPTEASLNAIREKLNMSEDMDGLKALWEEAVADRAKVVARRWKTSERFIEKREFRNKKVIHVSFDRIITEIWNKGYYTGTPKNTRAFLGGAARVLAGIALNRKEGRDPLEVPYRLPPDSKHGNARWVYCRGRRTWKINNIFDYPWDIYLRERGYAAVIVMDASEEDSEFFTDGMLPDSISQNLKLDQNEEEE